MSSKSDNNKRIAKNTLLLYIRMGVMMAINLYTSRVILNALGVVDYGLFNVVGGLVIMFSVLSKSLTNSISRYLTFELGKGETIRLKEMFSSALVIQFILCAIILVFAETIGLWFLNAKMTIPIERASAVQWVYQMAILSFLIGLISVPFNAIIVAHERMSAFAYISVIDAFLKLIIAFLIYMSPMDKLVFYAFLILLETIFQNFIYWVYCKRNFIECSFRLKFNKGLVKEMANFAGWNFFGTLSSSLRLQGVDVVINIFFGPTVNAAKGIATSVNSAVNGFVTNMMMAVNPQIIKSYSSGDREYMMNLINQSARYSFYLLFILALPVILNTDYILHLWLGFTPSYSVRFIQFVLLLTMLEALSNPLETGMMATGNIRNYQIIIGFLQILNLPLCYLMFKISFGPEMVYVIACLITFVCLFIRWIMLKPYGFSVRAYIKSVLSNIFFVGLVALPIPFIFRLYFSQNFIGLLANVFVCVCVTCLSIVYVGCSIDERKFIFSRLKNKVL